MLRGEIAKDGSAAVAAGWLPVAKGREDAPAWLKGAVLGHAERFKSASPTRRGFRFESERADGAQRSTVRCAAGQTVGVWCNGQHSSV